MLGLVAVISCMVSYANTSFINPILKELNVGPNEIDIDFHNGGACDDSEIKNEGIAIVKLKKAATFRGNSLPIGAVVSVRPKTGLYMISKGFDGGQLTFGEVKCKTAATFRNNEFCSCNLPSCSVPVQRYEFALWFTVFYA